MPKNSISKTIGNKLNVFQSIANTIHHITSLPVSIWAPDENKSILKIVAAVGLPENYVQTASLDLKKPTVTGDAYKTKKIQVARDISSDPRWVYKKQAREMNWKSAICVPIEVDSVSIGTISVYAYTERSISDLKHLLPGFAKQIALTLEASRQREVLQKILDIDAKLQSMSESPKSILQAIVKGACEITGANCAVVYPFDADRGEFYDIGNIASHGLQKKLKISEKPRSKGGMASYIKQKGEVALANIETEEPAMLTTSPFIKRERIRAFMGIALKVGNDILGVLYVNFRSSHNFTKQEKNTIRLFAHQASYAVNNTRLYQQLGSRVKALSKLHKVAPRLVSISPNPRSLKSVLKQIAEDAQLVLGADLVDLYQYNQNEDDFILPPVQLGKRYVPYVIKDKILEDDVVRVIIKGGIQYVTNAQEDKPLIQPFKITRPKSPKERFVVREKLQSVASVPLAVGDELVGVLFANYRNPQTFSQQQRELIELFAGQAAIAIYNSRLYQQAKQQSETLEKLQSIGIDLVSLTGTSKDLRSTLKKIAKSAQDVLRADLVDLYQYFEELDEFNLPPVQSGKRYEPQVKKEKIQQDDVILSIVKSKQTHYILDSQVSTNLITPFSEDRTGLPAFRFAEREKVKSTAAIPLIVGGEVVGALFANYRTSQSFLLGQRKLIELFAHQAAIAIWNARLFTSMQKRLDERLNDISVFQHIYERMYSANQEELMSLIAEKATQLTGAKYGVLWLADKDRAQLTCTGVVGDERPASALPKLSLDRKSINGWVMSTGKPYLSNDIKADPHYRNWYKDARSELAVPLLYNNNVIGTLDVESTSVDNFTDDHVELLKTLANQAAIAIQNARIIKKLDILDDVGRALTDTIRLQEQEILDLIYRKASGLMDTNNMYIALYDERTDIVRFGLAFVNGERIDVENNEKWQPRKAGKGRTEEIIRTRHSILTTTMAKAKVWYAQSGRKEYVGYPMPSWIGVPMVAGDKVLGVIATYHPEREYVYNIDDLDVLRSMANQAAIAIDNSRMFYDVNQRLSALVNFEQEVTSVIHSGESRILELIHEQVSQLMDTQNFYIALYDKSTGIIRFGLAFRDGKQIDWPSRKAGKGKTEVILNTKNPLFHATYAESKTWYSMPEHKEYVGEISSSWLGVPMIVRNDVIGVIATHHLTKEYLYDGNDLEFLQAMANQAAVALESARSFEEAQNRIEDLETVDSIVQTISTKVGTTDLVQAIVSQIREHLDCSHCAIFFPENIGNNTLLVSRFAHGEFAEKIKSRSFKLGEGLTGWVFEHGKAAIVPDVSQDERFSPARARASKPRSLLVVPVTMNGKTVGVISADHNRINGFDEDDLRLVETVAGHVSIALEKGRSYEEIARLYQEARGDAIAAKQLATLGTAIAALQHRINNTLNIIIPNIKRLRSRINAADPTIKEILDIIERNTRYTSDILMRIQTPLQEVESSSVNVNSLLSDIAGTAKKEWGKNSSHPAVKITLNLDDSIPLIHLPVGQVSEIVRNLIDNAYRAMKKGGILLITSEMEQNTIYVRLKDTAKGGIPPAIRERLFQKPVPSREPGHGAGLGLWLSKLMLQGVSGDVTVEETGPTGTTMLISIPVSTSGKEATV